MASASCPYCQAVLDPAPSRAKKCPHCGNRIVTFKGDLYTDAGAAAEKEAYAATEVIHIVGESNYQPAILGIRPGDAALLVREPKNPHDRNAVQVDVRGKKVGYLPRDMAAGIAGLIDRGGRPTAVVRRLIGGRLNEPMVGVMLNVRLDGGDASRWIDPELPPLMANAPERTTGKSFLSRIFGG